MIVNTSWGGDLDTFVQQASARGVMTRGHLRLSPRREFAGASRRRNAGPASSSADAAIITSCIRNMHRSRPFREFVEQGTARRRAPTQSTPCYTWPRRFAALGGAYKKAALTNNVPWPSKEQLMAAFRGLKFRGLTSEVSIREDNQGLEDQLIGTTIRVPEYGFAVLDRISIYPAELVTTPIGAKSADWLSRITLETRERSVDRNFRRPGKNRAGHRSMSIQTILLAALDGLSYGAQVFLVAVGLSLIFGVLRIVNVAHGGFYAIGAYVAASFSLLHCRCRLEPVADLSGHDPVCLPRRHSLGRRPRGSALLRRIYGKEQVLQLLVTFAVFMILEDMQKAVWGVRPYFIDAPLGLLGTVSILGINYSIYQLIIVPLFAAVVLVGLRYVLRRTRLGRIVTAVTEDREAAAAMGVDATRGLPPYLHDWRLVRGLRRSAGFGGDLTRSGMGAGMTILSFAVAATAGLGRIEGAAVAALMIGLGRSLAVYMAPEFDVLVPLSDHVPGPALQASGPVQRAADEESVMRPEIPAGRERPRSCWPWSPLLVPWTTVMLTIALAIGLSVLGHRRAVTGRTGLVRSRPSIRLRPGRIPSPSSSSAPALSTR